MKIKKKVLVYIGIALIPISLLIWAITSSGNKRSIITVIEISLYFKWNYIISIPDYSIIVYIS